MVLFLQEWLTPHALETTIETRNREQREAKSPTTETESISGSLAGEAGTSGLC